MAIQSVASSVSAYTKANIQPTQTQQTQQAQSLEKPEPPKVEKLEPQEGVSKPVANAQGQITGKLISVSA